ncbi:MAG TPA: efflux RND transporter periplasmic adaptor subunit [Pantanalinema sp.]
MTFDWQHKTTRILVPLLGAAILAAGTGVGYTWLQSRSASVHADHAHGEETYTCPMHPQVKSDKPGSCPICGMDLVAVKAAPAPQAHDQQHAAPAPEGLQEVVLSPEQQVLANVKTEAVAPRSLSSAVSAPGKITYDETRLSQLTAWIEGRIERLYVDATGDRVSKGQPIGTLYSPEAVAAMQEYLVALRSYREMKGSAYPDLAEGAKSLVEASRQRLKLWGITPAQIKQLERTQSPTLALAINANTSGVVLKKLVQPGQYVKTGDVLYEIADLSRVWAEADVFEAQMKDVKVGQRAEITTPAHPGKTFVGRVSFIYPFLNPESRTVRIRVDLANQDGRLKPDMFVATTFKAPALGAQPLAVAASAVIDTGRRKLVYVETAPGVFRPREVSLGQKAGDHYPVLSGLSKGEKVATSGGFLLDADSQIQAGMGAADAHQGAHR